MTGRRAVGDGQAAASRDGMQVMPAACAVRTRLHHGAAHLGQVAVVHARADVHVQAHQRQAVLRMVCSASGRSVCQMPCLLCSPPVLVLLLWP